MALSTIPTRALSEQGINFRNLIINGDMSIAQRGTTSGINSSTYGGVDRFRFGISSSGTFTVEQDTDTPTGQGFGYSYKASCTTSASTTLIALQHRLEGQNLQSLKFGTSNAESFTVSFWVKSNLTGTGVLEIYEADGIGIGKSYTINSANTWEKKILTFIGDTSNSLANDNTKQLQLDWWLGANSTYTTGTLPSTWSARVNANRAAGLTLDLASSTSNYINITGVQLEVGTTASDFEFLPYDVNLQRCFRYYEKDTSEYICGHNNSNDFGSRWGHLQWKATKRATPSLTANPDAGNVNLTRRTIYGCGVTVGGAVNANGTILPNGYIADSEL